MSGCALDDADYQATIAALERPDADRAEKRLREQTLSLAAHIDKHGAKLDGV